MFTRIAGVFLALVSVLGCAQIAGNSEAEKLTKHPWFGGRLNAQQAEQMVATLTEAGPGFWSLSSRGELVKGQVGPDDRGENWVLRGQPKGTVAEVDWVWFELESGRGARLTKEEAVSLLLKKADSAHYRAGK